MKNFLKPTKEAWIIFALMVIVLNGAIFLFGFLLWMFNVYVWWPFLIVLTQGFWLSGVLQTLGIDTNGRCNEFACLPNFLGWTSVIVGTVIVLFTYYIIACSIAAYRYKLKSKSANPDLQSNP